MSSTELVEPLKNLAQPVLLMMAVAKVVEQEQQKMSSTKAVRSLMPLLAKMLLWIVLLKI